MNNKIFRFFLLAGLMLLSLGASAQSKVTGKVGLISKVTILLR